MKRVLVFGVLRGKELHLFGVKLTAFYSFLVLFVMHNHVLLFFVMLSNCLVFFVFLVMFGYCLIMFKNCWLFVGHC